jgi:hypothetical protein
MLSVAIFMLVTQAKPVDKLAPYRPPASIFTMLVACGDGDDDDHAGDRDDAYDDATSNTIHACDSNILIAPPIIIIHSAM